MWHKNIIDEKTHRARHLLLHDSLDSIISDYIRTHQDKLLRNTSLLDLLGWSSRQVKEGLDHNDCSISEDEHIYFHEELHKNLDELISDWILQQNNISPDEKALLLDRTNLFILIDWSYNQTINPTSNYEE